MEPVRSSHRNLFVTRRGAKYSASLTLFSAASLGSVPLVGGLAGARFLPWQLAGLALPVCVFYSAVRLRAAIEGDVQNARPSNGMCKTPDRRYAWASRAPRPA